MIPPVTNPPERRGLLRLLVLCAGVLLALAARPVSAASVDWGLDTGPFEFLPDAGTANPGQMCRFDSLLLPRQFFVMAAGTDSGRPMTVQIDGSGEESTQVDLGVNSPEVPVVLMLFARSPTVWNIGWTPGTRILAVYVSGQSRQTVAGISRSVPVLISTVENDGPCGATQVVSADPEPLRPLAMTLFGHPVDEVVFPIRNGRALVGFVPVPGTTFRTHKSNPPDQWTTPEEKLLLQGVPALNNAVRLGQLRRATPADAAAWLGSGKAQPGLDRYLGKQAWRHKIPLTPLTYVLTGSGGLFKLPQGLSGTQAPVLIVPQGVARPIGDRGQSTVYDFNTMTCVGPACVF